MPEHPATVAPPAPAPAGPTPEQLDQRITALHAEMRGIENGSPAYQRKLATYEKLVEARYAPSPPAETPPAALGGEFAAGAVTDDDRTEAAAVVYPLEDGDTWDADELAGVLATVRATAPDPTTAKTAWIGAVDAVAHAGREPLDAEQAATARRVRLGAEEAMIVADARGYLQRLPKAQRERVNDALEWRAVGDHPPRAGARITRRSCRRKGATGLVTTGNGGARAHGVAQLSIVPS